MYICGLLTGLSLSSNVVYALGYLVKGYGLKYRGARVQPLTRGPEADETKTMTVALPHRV